MICNIDNQMYRSLWEILNLYHIVLENQMITLNPFLSWHKKGEKSQGWIYFSAKTTQHCATLPKLANGI